MSLASRGWARAAGAGYLVLLALVTEAVVSIAPPSIAEAQPNKADEAKTRFQKGVELFQEADFQGSLVEFKRSYELVPNFNVLYNIGQVYFQMQDYANALRTLQQYLELGGNRVTASRRTDVERDIEKLRGRVAPVTIRTSVSGAEIFVDDVSVGTSPLKDTIMVSSGKRRFSASKEGYNTARDTKEVVSGETTEVSLNLTELAPGQTNVVVEPPGGGAGGAGAGNGSNAPETHRNYVGPIVTWSITGACAIVWGTLGGLALSADADLTKLKGTQTTQKDLEAAASKSKNLAIGSDVMMAFTITGAAVSTVWTIVIATSSGKPESDQRAPKKSASEVRLGVAPGGATVFGTF